MQFSLATVALAASLLFSHALSAEARADSSGREQLYHQEVVRLHEVIEAWLAGSIPNTDDAYRNFSDAMADDFEIISPSGSHSDRNAIVSSFRTAHGSRGEQFSVVIKNIRTRLLNPLLALLTYEEWQLEEGRATARLSSVVLKEDPTKPGGVAWIHLHETWLPGLSPSEE